MRLRQNSKFDYKDLVLFATFVYRGGNSLVDTKGEGDCSVDSTILHYATYVSQIINGLDSQSADAVCEEKYKLSNCLIIQSRTRAFSNNSNPLIQSHIQIGSQVRVAKPIDVAISCLFIARKIARIHHSMVEEHKSNLRSSNSHLILKLVHNSFDKTLLLQVLTKMTMTSKNETKWM